MKDKIAPDQSRRGFIAKIIPCCALSCMASSTLFASSLSGEADFPQQGENKFLNKMDPPITYLQAEKRRHLKYIGILNNLGKELGRGKLIEMLKRSSYEENVKMGKQLSGQIKSLDTFAGPFRDENSNLGKTIVREIVEDSEKAFEIRITACVEEIVFRDANAQDLGYACVCHADYGLPEGINPKLKLIRTKTLMQGHDCCNHRYVWNQ